MLICQISVFVIFYINLCYTSGMKYASIFFTILFIWLAVIIMAFTRSSTDEIFQLYLVVMVCTLILFLIGFAKK